MEALDITIASKMTRINRAPLKRGVRCKKIMSDDIEFLKSEVARLKTEQFLESNPLAKLAIEKDMQEALKL